MGSYHSKIDDHLVQHVQIAFLELFFREEAAVHRPLGEHLFYELLSRVFCLLDRSVFDEDVT
jgi:hypothetical protein